MTAESTADGLRRLIADAPPPEPLGAGPFVLYGAGGKGRECLRAFQTAGLHVAAVIDRRPIGVLDGVPVIGTDDPEAGRLAADGATAVVTIFNPGVDTLGVREFLRTVGFRRVLGITELRQCLPVPNTFWLSDRAAMTPSAAEAAWLWERLADPESRSTLFEAIALRQTGDPRWLRAPNVAEQYLPAGVPLPRQQVRFIDGGGYDGDTLASLHEARFSFSAVAAFEPDPANFSRLSQRSRGLPLGDVSIWPCGLDATTRQLRFRSDGLASSTVDDAGESMIQVVAIDEVLPEFKPTYVKLDIEGSEAAALAGMARTLAASRPAIAVCVYHRPADLWEIPRLIDDLVSDTDLYLRSHAWNGFDLVLYALPRELRR